MHARAVIGTLRPQNKLLQISSLAVLTLVLGAVLLLWRCAPQPFGMGLLSAALLGATCCLRSAARRGTHRSSLLHPGLVN